MLEAMTRLVSCPSCGVMYRHATGSAQATRGRCSRCDSVFPLAGPSAAYRVEAPGPSSPLVAPGVAGSHPMTIGMDDPTLAARLQETGVDPAASGERPVMAYHVVADPADGEAAATADDVALVVPSASRWPARIAGAALALSCAGLGAAAGFLLARDIGQDFRVTASIGAAAGLLAAWGWLRWMSRSS